MLLAVNWSSWTNLLSSVGFFLEHHLYDNLLNLLKRCINFIWCLWKYIFRKSEGIKNAGKFQSVLFCGINRTVVSLMSLSAPHIVEQQRVMMTWVNLQDTGTVVFTPFQCFSHEFFCAAQTPTDPRFVFSLMIHPQVESWHLDFCCPPDQPGDKWSRLDEGGNF